VASVDARISPAIKVLTDRSLLMSCPRGSTRRAPFSVQQSTPMLPKGVHYAHSIGITPSGDDWDALNWLTAQTSELAYAAFAPRGTPPDILSALRTAFELAAKDPDFNQGTIAS
jgi:hypothetical protein